LLKGIVSSLKEAYGFIERADVVAEIFFHYTEFSGDINELMIGDDVQFNLQDRLVSMCVTHYFHSIIILHRKNIHFFLTTNIFLSKVKSQDDIGVVVNIRTRIIITFISHLLSRGN